MTNGIGAARGRLFMMAGLFWQMTSAGYAEMKTASEFTAVGEHGMVASDSALASKAGEEILRAGGNAIDAAAATSFALAVTRPYNAGIGGGGFVMVRFAKTGEVFVLDYRETAPAASTPDMFVKARAAHPSAAPPSRFGGLAVAVPGHLAGHAALLQRFGNKTLRDVIEPARRLADKGFAVDEHYTSLVADVLQDIDKYHLKEMAAPLRHALLFDGRVPAPGTIVQHPQLAATLKQIAAHGPSAFYRGKIARDLVTSVQNAGGILTLEDLAHYKPTWREAIRAKYRGYEVLLMPPPSSGGICIAETLNILENWPLGDIQKRDPGLAAHLTVEAIKHAFADRARHLGDADFVKVPVAKLTDEGYASELARRIHEDGVSKPQDYGWRLPVDAGTTHFCVADQWGNVVAATETVNTSFGSFVMAGDSGVVLNNEMDDLTAEPGRKNAFGLMQSPLNEVAPGKRPLSSMSPTIVLSGGKPILAVGGAGGPRIITATLQVLLNVVEYQMPLAEAISRPRFHHQWDPDSVFRNRFAADDPVVIGLQKRGHTVSDERKEAVVQAIQIIDGKYIGASDPRKGGKPAGY